MKFIHLRFYLRPDETADPQVLAKGGATIAYDTPLEGKLRFYIAKCCNRDVFCKKIGREVAAGRFVRSNVTIDVPEGLTRQQIREILKEQYLRAQERYDPLIRYYIK